MVAPLSCADGQWCLGVMEEHETDSNWGRPTHGAEDPLVLRGPPTNLRCDAIGGYSLCYHFLTRPLLVPRATGFPWPHHESFECGFFFGLFPTSSAQAVSLKPLKGGPGRHAEFTFITVHGVQPLHESPPAFFQQWIRKARVILLVQFGKRWMLNGPLVTARTVGHVREKLVWG